MKQMVPSLTVGVLDVSALNFRSDCLAYPMKVLQKIQNFLPSFAAYKCDEILLYCKVHKCTRFLYMPNVIHSLLPIWVQMYTRPVRIWKRTYIMIMNCKIR